ncbi:MAG: hypothetical protein ACON5B_05270 [Myxococcota bacterium]
MSANADHDQPLLGILEAEQAMPDHATALFRASGLRASSFPPARYSELVPPVEPELPTMTLPETLAPTALGMPASSDALPAPKPAPPESAHRSPLAVLAGLIVATLMAAVLVLLASGRELF